jgi:hypothetical protein
MAALSCELLQVRAPDHWLRDIGSRGLLLEANLHATFAHAAPVAGRARSTRRAVVVEANLFARVARLVKSTVNNAGASVPECSAQPHRVAQCSVLML